LLVYNVAGLQEPIFLYYFRLKIYFWWLGCWVCMVFGCNLIDMI